jgi:DNA repair exonuclease SbcCD ATPase subunit
MSDTADSLGDFASAVESLNGNDDSSQGYDPGQETQATQPNLSAFATNYLANVPEEEHELVIRHIQEWDKGFQQFAQRVAQERSQYQQLGSFEDLQAARQVAQMLSDDPTGVTQWLIEQGYGPQQAAQASVQMQQNGVQPTVPQQQDPFANLPPEIQQKLQQLDQIQPQLKRYETALGALYQNLQQKDEAAEVAQATQTLEAELAEAHAKHGDFDEYLVLLQMREGIPMDQAIQKIGGLVQNQVNQRSAPNAPRVMSARSLPPQHKSVSDMSDDERVSALAQMVQGTFT